MLDPFLVADWDKRLLAHPRASAFHTRLWAQVISGTYGHQPVNVGKLENDKFISLLPIMEINSWLTGRRGVSLPFSDFCEPLMNESSAGPDLLDSALQIGRKRGWKYFEWRGDGLADDAVPAASLYGHVINLDADEERLFERLSSPVRRAVRRAEKLGVEVRFRTDLEAVRNYYALHCTTRRRHGLPPQPFAFFRKIQEHILAEGNGVVALARLGTGQTEKAGLLGEHSDPEIAPVNLDSTAGTDDPSTGTGGQAFAGAIFFQFGRQAVYKFGAGDQSFQDLRGNTLIMWRAMQRFRNRGVETLHLGRTGPGQGGLRRYKLGFGARELPIRYFQYDLQEERFRAPRDLSTGWHNRIFRNLPSRVNRLIGELIYPHLD